MEVDLSCDFVGLKLSSPIIAASAGTTETVERVSALAEAGVGAAVMKSLFEDELCREAPRPCFKVFRRSGSVTLYSYEQASVWGPARYAEEVTRAREELVVPVIPSINCKTEDGWRNYAKRMADAGAPAIEMNVSCPHGSLSFRMGRAAPEAILRAVEVVRAAVDLPLIVKLSGQFTSPPAIVSEVERLGVQGVTLFNRFTGLEIDTVSERPVMHGAYAGHGGPWALHFGLRWISAISPNTQLHIAASGGVNQADDVVKYHLAGARAVQVCSLIYLKGVDAVGKLVSGLKTWMRRKGYVRLDDFRGKVSGAAIATTAEVDRTQEGVCVIDPDNCKNCGLCARVCIYGAPKPNQGKSHVIGRECVGCGLCAEVCPTGAISFQR